LRAVERVFRAAAPVLRAAVDLVFRAAVRVFRAAVELVFRAVERVFRAVEPVFRAVERVFLAVERVFRAAAEPVFRAVEPVFRPVDVVLRAALFRAVDVVFVPDLDARLRVVPVERRLAVFARDRDFAAGVERRLREPPLEPSSSSPLPISFRAVSTATGTATPSAAPATTFVVRERPSSLSSGIATTPPHRASLKDSMKRGRMRSRSESGACSATQRPALSAACSAIGSSVCEAESHALDAAVPKMERDPESSEPRSRDREPPLFVSALRTP
jgi:hypothetical protein